MWRPLAAKSRKDPLGPASLNTLASQLQYVRTMEVREHIITTGEHNAWSVPRVCRRVSGTAVSPASSDISSVTNPATGRYVVNLAASRFTADMRVQLNAPGDGAKPLVCAYNRISATQIEVYTHWLTTALGSAGNAWAATSTDFDIAIHSEPLAAGSWNSAHPVPPPWVRLDNLEDSSNRWNGLVQGAADTQALLAAEHVATTGEHNTPQVARVAGMVRYNLSALKYETDGAYLGTITLARTSAGICTVTHDAHTAPSMAFVCPDYARLNGGASADRTIVIARETSTTVTTVYIFQWIAASGWWARADADFFIAIHGS